MPLKPIGGLPAELAWWWEAEDRPLTDEPRARLDRARLGALAAQPAAAASLRRFLREGMPGRVLPLDDADLLDLAARALDTGRLDGSAYAGEHLTSYGEIDEPAVEEAQPITPTAPAEEPHEEVCWPCLRAAASARALKAAAAQGAPLIGEMS